MSGFVSFRNVATSMSVERNQEVASSFLSRARERAASGLRINRSADDAAGKAVAEGLRAQVRGLSQANANAQDAINLIQTADGGMNQVTNVLQRLRELFVQAGNDTYTMGQRVDIQAEIDQLKGQLDQIASQTQFGGRNLLDGSIARSRFAEPNGTYVQTAPPIVGAPPDQGPLVSHFTVSGFAATLTQYDFTLVPGNPFVGFPGVGYEISENGVVVNSGSQYNTGYRGNPGVDFDPHSTTGWDITFGFSDHVALTADIGKSFKLILDPRYGPNTIDHSIEFQLGSNQGQTVHVGIPSMSAYGLFVEGITCLGTTEAAAHANIDDALHKLDDALSEVNTERSRIGAIQNRVEHTVERLGGASTDQATAQSRIEDADMAQEAAAMTRGQVLQQASLSLLTQANTVPEMALKLLNQGRPS